MRQTRKSSLFLLELIIAILFFSLSAAVCVKLFSYAYLKIEESDYRSRAVFHTQTAIELFKHAGGDETNLIAYLGAREISEGIYQCYLDEDIEDDFIMTIEVQGTEHMEKLRVSVTPPRFEEAIYSVTASVYKQGGALDAENE